MLILINYSIKLLFKTTSEIQNITTKVVGQNSTFFIVFLANKILALL